METSVSDEPDTGLCVSAEFDLPGAVNTMIADNSRFIDFAPCSSRFSPDRRHSS
jgi:hypothetical protein